MLLLFSFSAFFPKNRMLVSRDERAAIDTASPHHHRRCMNVSVNERPTACLIDESLFSPLILQLSPVQPCTAH